MRFGVDAVAAAADENGIVYSSTAIRQRLSAGEPEGVIGLLGRPWEIAGRVEHGDERGRKLGFPTANLAMGEYMEPKLGVYAIRAALDEGGAPLVRRGRQSRPAPHDQRRGVQPSSLFDFRRICGKHLRVALLGFIRPEMKFDGLEALRVRIGEDCRAARAIAGAYGGPMPGLLGPGPAAV
jgi:riboflavin kinase/FMN adenylyltransferase